MCTGITCPIFLHAHTRKIANTAAEPVPAAPVAAAPAPVATAAAAATPAAAAAAAANAFEHKTTKCSASAGAFVDSCSYSNSCRS